MTDATNAARKSTELSLVQYKSGETDYTTVLSAAGSEYALEDSLVQSMGNELLSVVSIYRALGGGWQVREGVGFVSDAVALEMSERSDWGGMIDEVENTGVNLEQAE